MSSSNELIIRLKADRDKHSASLNASCLAGGKDIITNLYDDDAHFIYDNSSRSLYCNFDMILREDGRIDAPKIRKGYEGNSIVDEIRRLCYENPGYDWYLVWLGLRNQELIFWLIRNLLIKLV